MSAATVVPERRAVEAADAAPGLSAEIVAVTPELALDWLTQPNVRGPNRRLNPQVVSRYAKAMKAGKWQLTGEAIKFGKSGYLLDGQHRLNAIIESGATIRTLVIYGVADPAQDVMDTNRVRRASDVLAIRGYANVTMVAAAVRVLIGLENGTLKMAGAARSPGNDEVLAYVQAHPDVLDCAELSNKGRARLLVTPSVYLAAHVLMSRVDADAASEFHALFTSGAGLEKRDPIFAVRDRLLYCQAKREKLSIYVQLSAVLRAWNAWRSGQKLSRFLLFKDGGTPIAIPEQLR